MYPSYPTGFRVELAVNKLAIDDVFLQYSVIISFKCTHTHARTHAHAHTHTRTHAHTHTLHSPLLGVTWVTPVPSTRIYLELAFNNNILLAYNLQSSDAGTFTCQVPTVGNFSVKLKFIGTPQFNT